MLLYKQGILEDSAVSVDPVYEDGEPVAKILKTFFFVAETDTKKLERLS